MIMVLFEKQPGASVNGPILTIEPFADGMLAPTGRYFWEQAQNIIFLDPGILE